MAGLRILWVGRTERGFIADGVAHYRGRIQPFQPLAIEEVRTAAHSGRDPGQAVAREGEQLLRRIDPPDVVVLLDERGRTPSTREFADLLQRLLAEAPRPPTFIVGGAYGVDEAVRGRAQHVVALSRLTFPHQLVRVILLEQVYRALSLLAGHGYHHE